MKPKINTKAISPIKLTPAALVFLCQKSEAEAGESLPQGERGRQRQRRMLCQRFCSYLLAVLMLRYRVQVPWGRWYSSLAPLPVFSFSSPFFPVLCSPVVLCSSSCSLCFCLLSSPHTAIHSSVSFPPCSLHPRWVFSSRPRSSPHGIRGCGSLVRGSALRCRLLLTPALWQQCWWCGRVANWCRETERHLLVRFTGLSRKRHMQPCGQTAGGDAKSSQGLLALALPLKSGFHLCPFCAAREAWRAQTQVRWSDCSQFLLWWPRCSGGRYGEGSAHLFCMGLVPSVDEEQSWNANRSLCRHTGNGQKACTGVRTLPNSKFQGPAPKYCVTKIF